MDRLPLDKEAARTCNVTGDLSIQLVEIPYRANSPKCSHCGKGDYWNIAWPAGLALSRYLAGGFPSKKLNGHRVLVIGCGVGLEGLVLAKLGAIVSVLDHIPDALHLFYRNCLLNEIEPFETICCCWRDSKKIRKIGKYDLLVGSDVLYNPDDANCIKSLLTTTLKSGGIALFANPDRSGVEDFFQLLAKSEFRVKSYWANSRWASRNERIRIYRVERLRVNNK